MQNHISLFFFKEMKLLPDLGHIFCGFQWPQTPYFSLTWRLKIAGIFALSLWWPGIPKALCLTSCPPISCLPIPVWGEQFRLFWYPSVLYSRFNSAAHVRLSLCGRLILRMLCSLAERSWEEDRRDLRSWERRLLRNQVSCIGSKIIFIYLK